MADASEALPVAEGVTIAKEDKTDRTREVNDTKPYVQPDPLKEAFESAMAEERKKEEGLERDDKGRFLPREPKESEDADAKDGEKPTGSDSGQPVGAEVEKGDDSTDTAEDSDEEAEPAADESAAEAVEEDDSLDIDLVIRATELGIKKDKINSYSNKELKAAIETREEMQAETRAKADEKPAEAKDTKPAEPEPSDADYDALIEDGHDARLVNMLRKTQQELKFLREQSARPADPQKATQDSNKPAEANPRLDAEIDKWFDGKGEKFGKGSQAEMLKQNPKSPEAAARQEVVDMASAVMAGLTAQGKPVPPLAELLDMGYRLVHPKAVEQEAERQVARRIQQKRNGKTISRPAVAPPPKPKVATSFDEMLKESIQEKSRDLW